MTRVHADLDAIKALRRGVLTYAGRQADALDAAEAEITYTEALLAEAVQDARYEISRRQAALEACYREAAEAAYYGDWVDCSRFEYDLSQAEERLARLLRRQRRLEEAVFQYQIAANRLENALGSDIPAATSYLADRIAALEAYHASQVMAEVMALATSGAASPLGAVIGAVRSLQGEMYRVLGGAGEQAAAQVLTEEFGLQEMPFDRPKHGFDRVFRAPGIPLVVMEAKTSSAGTLQLGQTQAGQQGSAAWLAAQADNMVDRESAQWSPANERIGRLVQELGPANIPVLSVVVNPTSNRADIYYRHDSGEWRLLQGDIQVGELSSQPPPGPVTPAESREGAGGGAERRG